MGKHGEIFLGNDAKNYGEEGTGWVEYDPDFECVGGPIGSPDRKCPYTLNTASLNETLGKADDHSDRYLHISIPSYRDLMCPQTLYNIFSKAEHPKKIQVRVLEQYDPDKDEACMDAYCKLYTDDNCLYQNQIEMYRVDAKDAAGPTWARGKLGKHVEQVFKDGMISAQDFCMSTDSHMDFEPNWDTNMIQMWELTNNEYAILSTYVAGTEQLGVNLNNQHEVPHLCMVTFTDNVRTHATKCARNLSKPKLTNAIWGAGLSFSKCHAELKVPVDPHTPGVFDGEEFNRAARFFTYGYDIYTPHRVYVLHNYQKSEYAQSGMSWSRNTNWSRTKQSHVRLKTMIDVPGGELDPEKKLQLKQSKYGLGDRRTIDQLIQFSGIDLRHSKISIDGKNRCGNIQWVPFQQSSKGVNYIPKFDEYEQPLDTPDEGSVWYTIGNSASHSNKNASTTSEMNDHLNGIKGLRNGNIAGLKTNPNINRRRPPSLPFIVQFVTFCQVTVMVIIIWITKGTGRNKQKKRKL